MKTNKLQIKKLYDEGMSTKAISEKLDCSQRNVQHILKNLKESPIFIPSGEDYQADVKLLHDGFRASLRKGDYSAASNLYRQYLSLKELLQSHPDTEEEAQIIEPSPAESYPLFIKIEIRKLAEMEKELESQKRYVSKLICENYENKLANNEENGFVSYSFHDKNHFISESGEIDETQENNTSTNW